MALSVKARHTAGIVIHQDTAVPDIATLISKLEQFRDERDWRQFHTLKDLAISVSLEAAELLELTQWKDEAELARLKQDPAFRQRLREECADVFLYLLLVAGEGGFDLLQAAEDKIAMNAQKYPVDQARGSARKYTALDGDPA
jgi:NTP pyrophosphatase (non-canonical NTP hydrolase)